MCGRFVSSTGAADLAAHFGTTGVTGALPARWNVTPASEVWVVHEEPAQSGRLLEPMRWGLVPSWAKDPTIGSRLINARCETAASKPSFRSAFRRRRCLLPADGFYEWQIVPGRRTKQPWYFTDLSGAPLALAGLWEQHADPPTGDPIGRTCTILTRTADDVVGPVHDRMPVILPPGVWDAWLDCGLDDPDAVDALLTGVHTPDLVARAVGTAVGNPRNEGPSLLDPPAPD